MHDAVMHATLPMVTFLRILHTEMQQFFGRVGINAALVSGDWRTLLRNRPMAKQVHAFLVCCHALEGPLWHAVAGSRALAISAADRGSDGRLSWVEVQYM